MRKCITKCLKGYDSCCNNCELQNLCEDACPPKAECRMAVEVKEES